MNIFNINTFGALSLKNRTKDFYKMLLQGLIIYLFLLSAFKFTVKSKEYFLFLAIFISFLYVFASIIIPISLKVRINKVVRKIQVENNRIIIITNKELVYNKKDICMEDVRNRFTGFSMRSKDGILIKTKTGKEYWIIEDFYNNFETLKELLIP